MITISNTNELLEFINREDVTPRQAREIVCKFLKVAAVFEMTKEQLIEHTTYYINTFGNSTERPFFLMQKTNEFDIKDIYPG